MNTNYDQKESIAISKEGMKYMGKFFSASNAAETKYTDYLAAYNHPFEAMSIAQQQLRDIYTLDEIQYFTAKSNRTPIEPPQNTTIPREKLDSIHHVWDEFLKEVKWQFGKDYSELSGVECDSLRAWVKRISMKYLLLYLHKKKGLGLKPRGEECNCVSMYTNIYHGGVYMPEYDKNTSYLTENKYWKIYYPDPLVPNADKKAISWYKEYEPGPLYYFKPSLMTRSIQLPFSAVPDFHQYGNYPRIEDLDGDGDNWAQYGGSVTAGPGFDMFNEHTGSCTAPYSYKFRTGGAGQSPNHVSFEILNACMDWIPELAKDCGCGLDLNLQYYYTTATGTQVYSVDNCFLHSARAMARVDQMAVVTVDDQSGVTKVLGAGGITDSAYIENAYTSDFWKGIFGMAGSAVAVVGNPSVQTITSLGVAIGRFLGGGMVKRYGGGKSINYDAILNGYKKVSIPVNNQHIISLYGALNLETNGEDGFYAYAYGKSNYSISWYVLKNSFDKMNPACCRPAFGAYYKHGGNDHNTKVKSHLSMASYPPTWIFPQNSVFLDFNLDKFESNYNCQGHYVNEFYKSAGHSIPDLTRTEPDGGIYWNINKEEKYHVELYDISGKLKISYNATPQKDVAVINTRGLSSGMYVIRIGYGGMHTHHKIMVE